MADKKSTVTFDDFSDVQPTDSDLYLIGFVGNNDEKTGLRERKLNLGNNIRFVNNQIIIKDNNNEWHSLSIGGNSEEGYYIQISDPITLDIFS